MSTIKEPTQQQRIAALDRAWGCLIDASFSAAREGRETEAAEAMAAAEVIGFMKREEEAK